VLDVIYNPLRTRLLQQAQRLGIPHGDGLVMLVAQAHAAAGLFRATQLPEDLAWETYRWLRARIQNIVLIGMPSSGKSTLGRALARRLNKDFVDIDKLIEQRQGCAIADIFAAGGEARFRQIERELVAQVARERGQVIATGGGVVLDWANMAALSQNGVVLLVDRDINALDSGGHRPLSADPDAVARLYRQRAPLYRRYGEIRVENNGAPEEDTLRRMEEALNAYFSH
jgi:shikimate dehydrogenase